jgi:hypothetical protein
MFTGFLATPPRASRPLEYASAATSQYQLPVNTMAGNHTITTETEIRPPFVLESWQRDLPDPPPPPLPGLSASPARPEPERRRLVEPPDDGHHSPDDGPCSPDDGHYDSPDDGHYSPDGGYHSPDDGPHSPGTSVSSPMGPPPPPSATALPPDVQTVRSHQGQKLSNNLSAAQLEKVANNVESILDKRERTAKLRFDMLLCRRNYTDRLQGVASHNRTCFDLTDQLMALPNRNSRAADDVHKKLVVAIEHFHKATALMREDEEHLRKAEDLLMKSESSLEAYEKASTNDIRHLLYNEERSPTESSESPEDGDVAEFPDWGSHSSTETPPLARQYYSRIGDIHLNRERLFNFESDHTRQLYERKSRFDRGERLSISESVWCEHYIKERQELIQEYSEAKVDVDALKKRCLEYGLDIEMPNLPPSDHDDPLDHSNRWPRKAGRSATPSNIAMFRNDSGLQQSFVLQALMDRRSTHERVEEWRRGVLQAAQKTTFHNRWVNVIRKARANSFGDAMSDLSLRSMSPSLTTKPPSSGAASWTDGEVEAHLMFPDYQQLVSPHKASSESGLSVPGHRAETHNLLQNGDVPEGAFIGERINRRYTTPWASVAEAKSFLSTDINSTIHRGRNNTLSPPPNPPP